MKLAKTILNKIEKNGKDGGLVSLMRLRHYLEAVGWQESKRQNMPVDKDGNPRPWYTYPMIDFLNSRITNSMNVFEYGSGNSTLWWAERVRSVTAIEHDREWFELMKVKVPQNVDYHYCELNSDGEYSKMIADQNEKFDIVVIDGRDRVNCARNVVAALDVKGIVIWDNSERARYQEGYDYLSNQNFRRIDFHGLGPININHWCTSIFYRDQNCFGI